MDNFKKLEEIRVKIDEVDKDLVSLLVKRANLVTKVKKAKKEGDIHTYSPAREIEIIKRVKELASKGDFPLDSIDIIFREIISATRSIISELKIAYLEDKGSFCYKAAKKQFGERVFYLKTSSYEESFKKVENKEVDFLVIPISTSLESLSLLSLEYLINLNLKISTEVYILEDKSFFGRFLIVGNSSPRKSLNDKTSFILEPKNTSSSFSKVLSVFLKNEVNVLNIQSGVLNSKREVFFFDLDGNKEDKSILKSIEEVNPFCSYLKVLGSYPKGL